MKRLYTRFVWIHSGNVIMRLPGVPESSIKSELLRWPEGAVPFTMTMLSPPRHRIFFGCVTVSMLYADNNSDVGSRSVSSSFVPGLNRRSAAAVRCGCSKYDGDTSPHSWLR
jgi:hypothetical protein